MNFVPLGRRVRKGPNATEMNTYEYIRVLSMMTVITRLMPPTPRALSGCARSRLVKRTMMRPERWRLISNADAALTNNNIPRATKFVLQ